jgi:hypothetical protein
MVMHLASMIGVDTPVAMVRPVSRALRPAVRAPSLGGNKCEPSSTRERAERGMCRGSSVAEPAGNEQERTLRMLALDLSQGVRYRPVM